MERNQRRYCGTSISSGFATLSFCGCTTVPTAINQTTCQTPIDFPQAVKAILDIPSLVARFQRTCASTSNHPNKHINTSTSQQPTNTTAYLRTHNDENSESHSVSRGWPEAAVGICGRAVFLEVGLERIFLFALGGVARLPSLRKVVCFERSGLARRHESRKRSDPSVKIVRVFENRGVPRRSAQRSFFSMLV
jgi:hypothetical protein